MSILLTRKLMFHPYHLPLTLYHQASQTIDIDHHHEFCEIVLIETGSGIHCTGGYEFPIEAQDVFIVKPGITHNYRDTCNLSLTNILYFSEETGIAKTSIQAIPGYKLFFESIPEMGPSTGSQRKLHLQKEQFVMVKDLISIIKGEIATKQAGYECMIISRFLQIICLLSRYYQTKNPKQTNESPNLASIFQYIDKYYQQPITLGQLAKKGNVSTSSLNRIFKKTTGHGPIEYLIKRRISKAGEILLNSDLTISEIAGQTGFRDSNFFSRQFKKYTGASPRLYRKWYSKKSG